MKRIAAVLVPVVLAAACGHDAPRENPLDPELTPGVVLEAALDDSTGEVTLTWSRYDGAQPFSAYRVERKVQGQEAWTGLDTVEEVGQTSHLDRGLAPGTAYDYRVVVSSAGGLTTASNKETVRGYSVGAVELLPVTADPVAGVVRVRWTRYRDPGFEGYRVVRTAEGGGEAEEAYVSTAPGDTAFTDTTVHHGVGYAYAVQVQAAGQSLTSQVQVGRLDLPEVVLEAPAMHSASATAQLEWPPYGGPRFAAYEVRVQEPGLDERLVATLASVAETALVDSGLRGSTEYAYRVDVRTRRGEVVTGRPASGAFHGLVQEWDLPLGQHDVVRLYKEGGQILALVGQETGVRLLKYTTDGGLAADLVLARVCGEVASASKLDPRTVSLARRSEGGWFVSAANRGTALARNSTPTLGVLDVDAQGQGRMIWTQDVSDGLSVYYAGVQRWRSIGLYSFWKTSGDYSTQDSLRISDLRVWADGEVLADLWESIGIGTARATVSCHPTAEGLICGGPGQDPMLSWVVGDRAEVGIEVTLSLPFRSPGVHSLLAGVWLRGTASNPYLFVRTNSSVRHDDLKPELGLLFIPPDSPFLVHLEAAGDGFTGWVRTSSRFAVEDKERSWVTLVGHGDGYVLVNGTHKWDVSLTQEREQGVVEAPVSEARVWEDGAGQLWLGACLPAAQKVIAAGTSVSSRTGYLNWSLTTVTPSLGTGAGRGAGELFYPLSFDVGPDGRTFVLDAGNGRIQVFGADRIYITQWGRPGAGEGEFAFGGGRASEDFYGSVVVDEEGYIYVADVGNRRIQKFAP